MMEIENCGGDVEMSSPSKPANVKRSTEECAEIGRASKEEITRSRDNAITSDENDNNNTAKRIRGSPHSEGGDKQVSSEIVRTRGEKLEVPSAELKLIQKQVLIEKLMASPEKKTDGVKCEEEMEIQSERIVGIKAQQRKPPQPKKEMQMRKTFKMRSSVLDRAKCFLPEFKTANEELLRLPDPSKLSLESESDWDEMDSKGRVDNHVPSTSAAAIKANSSSMKHEAGSSKTYVEMNLALVEQSDSDSSSDEELAYLQGPLKGITGASSTAPTFSKSPNKSQPIPAAAAESEATSQAENKPLITELN